MPYVGAPFRHDIFVSYSHGTLPTQVEVLADWSEAFAKALEEELSIDPDVATTLSIFLDREHRAGRGVDPMDGLTDTLKREVGASALLLVLVSDFYLKSEWCRKEREWWEQSQPLPNLATPEGLPVGLHPRQRVALVKMFRTQLAQWPTLFRDSDGVTVTGFDFHMAIGEEVRPLGWRKSRAEFAAETREAMLDVVGRVRSRLKHIRERALAWQAEREEAARLSQPEGQTVYLHARAEHALAWQDAAGRLGEFGFSVLPGEPDPVLKDPAEEQAVRERRVRDLRACDALLLLCTQDGRALDSDLIVVGKWDRHSARSGSSKLLPLGVVNTAGPVVETPVRLRNALNLQAKWVDGTGREWPQQLPPWLAEQARRLEAQR